MYTAQAAIGVRFGLNKRWEVIDLAQWTVANLFASFRVTQLTLLPSDSTTPVYLDLSTLASSYATFTGSVQAMLNAIGASTLEVTTTGKQLNNRQAVYADAYRAGYKVDFVNAVNGLDPTVPNTSLPNIRLTNAVKTINYTEFFNHCLVNINGFYHRTDTDGVNGVMVIGAATSLVKSGQNTIGLWSFTEVGALTTVPITPAMSDLTVAQKATITLPQDMTGKTLFLVLGGYFMLVDGVALSQVGNSSYTIDFARLGLVDRFYESSNYIDLTPLGIQRGVGNSEQIALADLTTPAMIRNWLSLSQTFAVVCDASEVYAQKYALKRTGLPQRYVGYQQPRSPAVLELGRQPPYFSVYEDHQWSINIYDNVIGNKLFYTVPTPEWLSTSGATQPGMPGHLQQAYLLEVGRDVSDSNVVRVGNFKMARSSSPPPPPPENPLPEVACDPHFFSSVLALLKFDDIGSTTIVDHSPYTATVNNSGVVQELSDAVGLRDGVFNSTNSCVVLGSHLDPSVLDSLTLEGWFKWAGPTADNSFEYLWQLDRSESNQPTTLCLNGDMLTLTVNGTDIAYCPSMPMNTWCFIQVQYVKSTRSLTIRRNGVLGIINFPVDRLFPASRLNVGFSGSSNGFGSKRFNGKIAELRYSGNLLRDTAVPTEGFSTADCGIQES